MKNEFKITKDLMKSWAKEFHLHGVANIVLLVLWCVILVCGMIGIAISIFLQSDWLNFYIFILLFVASIYKLFFSRYVICSSKYKMMSRTYGVAEWMRTTEFLDDKIILTDHNSTTTFRYDCIKKIKEKNNVVIIFFNDNLEIRLYKDAFVKGSWQACKEKINSMLNLQ